MAEIKLTVPDLGDFSDVEIIEILVSPGDSVQAEDPLITLESYKASMEIPSPQAGVVGELKVALGDRIELVIVASGAGDGEPHECRADVGDDFDATGTNPANSNTAGDWTPALAAELLNGVVPGSDVLVIRNGSPGAHALMTPFSDASSVFASAATTDYAVGDIAIASDCQKASVFQVTAVAASGGGVRLDHAAAGTPGNATASWATDQSYADGAEMLHGETWIYYVGAPAGGGPPALFQRRLSVDSATTTVTLAPEQLVESVDTMQVLYGVDAALDGAVDGYVTADAVADWTQVVTVRVSLLMRSPDEFGTDVDSRTYDVNGVIFNPVDDRRERQVFTTTIALRNRLP